MYDYPQQRQEPVISSREGVDYALIGPRDNRVHVSDTRRFPYNTICSLGRDFGDGRLRGCTATLITPHLALTAAHCLFSHRRGRAPVRIRVMPGRKDRDQMPFGHMDSQEYYVPRRYVRFRRAQTRKHFDYGVIVLPRPFTALRQFMPVSALSDAQMAHVRRQSRIAIAGYPGDRPVGTLWKHSEYLQHLDPHRLYYTVDTCPGHSGSPIWTVHPRTQQRTIIGVHTSGVVDEWGRAYGCSRATVLAPPGRVNSGVRITPDILTIILDPRSHAGPQGPLMRLP